MSVVVNEQAERILSASLGPIFQLKDCNTKYISLLNSVDSELLIKFSREVFPEFKNNPLARDQFYNLLKAVANSGIGFSEWLTRIVQTYGWLAKQNKTAKFSDIFQYISCSFEIDGPQSISDFLDFYGFERAIYKPLSPRTSKTELFPEISSPLKAATEIKTV